MTIWKDEIWENKLSIFFSAHEVLTGNARVIANNDYSCVVSCDAGDHRIIGEDVAAILRYEDAKDAITKYVNPENRQTGVVIRSLQPRREEQVLTIINYYGVANLIFHSKFYTGGALTFKWHKDSE